jgi:hypothetical protein
LHPWPLFRRGFSAFDFLDTQTAATQAAKQSAQQARDQTQNCIQKTDDIRDGPEKSEDLTNECAQWSGAIA